MLKLFLDPLDDLLFAESEGDGFGQERFHRLLQSAIAFLLGVDFAPFRDEVAASLLAFQHAVANEFRVGFRDRIGIHDQFAGKRPHARQRIANSQPITDDRRSDLVNDLAVDRDFSAGGNSNG